jgi:hypothetical protein
MPAKTAGAPTKLTIVSYQVGFGDCFLLTFAYPGDARHVLIDFGSTGLPSDVPRDQLMRIADDIKTRTAGKLHAIVESHRHADHISGFATAQGKGSGDVIASLKPDLVVQPWTEDPNAKPDATQATTTLSGVQRFVALLDAMHDVASAARDEARFLARGAASATASQLSFLGEKNLSNLSAVQNLQAMGKRHAYVNYGSSSGLENVLPGVTAHVLGPPTLVQSSAITQERSTDPSEFWQLQAATGTRFSSGGQDPLPRSARSSGARAPSSTQWFRQRVQSIRSEGLLELVRSLDKQMNNTSVILLFEIGTKLFLFPGDAQIENWSYALSQSSAQKKLAGVNVYKVGHHGSRNATPKSMWALFKNKSTKASPARLATAVSTMAGKFGSVGRATEVPRNTLVAELRKQSDFATTQDLHANTLSRVTEFSL